ncbi:hypothetical protein [Pseudoalteromonas luteoviolacea]|uniref:Uncharacterized protein n=2 Tax=Pseudoalteromonas luteoviolacea TaxID=43657 RepID=A0A161XSX8_9GAMM|nr:hypothetical protein [Pseudoalteromonas luteoviolacea]KZN29085.1 hypothetical protein N475_25335 [Pseudoalteromonas luteoviolacea DSM 6061]MBE0385410.1 hypothetical protein [Pseudoalteromonas luteoviolacea DSM 6061]
MEIKQLKGYKFVAVFTALVCSLALQDLFRNQFIDNFLGITGILGSFLLGLAAVSVVCRYVYQLFSNLKVIGLKKFLIGFFLVIASTIAWLFALIKFVVGPLISGTIDFETQYPAFIGLVNGVSGVVYFYLVWPIKKACLTKSIS